MKFCPKCHSDRVFSIFIKFGKRIKFLLKEVDNNFIIQDQQEKNIGRAKISHLLFHCDNCLYEWRERCQDYEEQ